MAGRPLANFEDRHPSSAALASHEKYIKIRSLSCGEKNNSYLYLLQRNASNSTAEELTTAALANLDDT
jgi:hypothetical protein